MGKYKKVTLQEKYKLLQKKHKIIFIFLIISIITMYSVLFLLLSTIILYKKEVKIDMDDLTPSEQENVRYVLSELKPEYLDIQKSITFTHNINNKTLQSRFLKDGSILLGFNRYKGDIYILYVNDELSLKRTLCHEIFHTIAPGIDDNTHFIINDLENYLPCYKRTERANLHLKN